MPGTTIISHLEIRSSLFNPELLASCFSHLAQFFYNGCVFAGVYGGSYYGRVRKGINCNGLFGMFFTDIFHDLQAEAVLQNTESVEFWSLLSFRSNERLRISSTCLE